MPGMKPSYKEIAANVLEAKNCWLTLEEISRLAKNSGQIPCDSKAEAQLVSALYTDMCRKKELRTFKFKPSSDVFGLNVWPDEDPSRPNSYNEYLRSLPLPLREQARAEVSENGTELEPLRELARAEVFENGTELEQAKKKLSKPPENFTQLSQQIELGERALPGKGGAEVRGFKRPRPQDGLTPPKQAAAGPSPPKLKMAGHDDEPLRQARTAPPPAVESTSARKAEEVEKRVAELGEHNIAVAKLWLELAFRERKAESALSKLAVEKSRAVLHRYQEAKLKMEVQLLETNSQIEEHEKVVENVMAQRGTSLSDVTMEGEDSFAENLQALAEIRRSQKELADLALKAVHLSRAVLKVLPASTPPERPWRGAERGQEEEG